METLVAAWLGLLATHALHSDHRQSDGLAADPEELRDLALLHSTTVHVPHGDALARRQLATMTGNTAPQPSSLSGHFDVLRMSPEPKMFKVDARRIVTQVHDFETVRDGTIAVDPDLAMDVLRTATASPTTRVPIVIAIALPLDAVHD